MRTGTAKDPALMWAMASGTAAAWFAHRPLQRLAEVDPDGVAAFAEALAEEGEMPEMADDPVEIATRMGFDAQSWIDREFAHADAAKAEAKARETAFARLTAEVTQLTTEVSILDRGIKATEEASR
jgi:hypothetical protein